MTVRGQPHGTEPAKGKDSSGSSNPATATQEDEQSESESIVVDAGSEAESQKYSSVRIDDQMMEEVDRLRVCRISAKATCTLVLQIIVVFVVFASLALNIVLVVFQQIPPKVFLSDYESSYKAGELVSANSAVSIMGDTVYAGLGLETDVKYIAKIREMNETDTEKVERIFDFQFIDTPTGPIIAYQTCSDGSPSSQFHFVAVNAKTNQIQAAKTFQPLPLPMPMGYLQLHSMIVRSMQDLKVQYSIIQGNGTETEEVFVVSVYLDKRCGEDFCFSSPTLLFAREATAPGTQTSCESVPGFQNPPSHIFVANGQVMALYSHENRCTLQTVQGANPHESEVAVFPWPCSFATLALDPLSKVHLIAMPGAVYALHLKNLVDADAPTHDSQANLITDDGMGWRATCLPEDRLSVDMKDIKIHFMPQESYFLLACIDADGNLYLQAGRLVVTNAWAYTITMGTPLHASTGVSADTGLQFIQILQARASQTAVLLSYGVSSQRVVMRIHLDTMPNVGGDAFQLTTDPLVSTSPPFPIKGHGNGAQTRCDSGVQDVLKCLSYQFPKVSAMASHMNLSERFVYTASHWYGGLNWLGVASYGKASSEAMVAVTTAGLAKLRCQNDIQKGYLYYAASRGGLTVRRTDSEVGRIVWDSSTNLGCGIDLGKGIQYSMAASSAASSCNAQPDL